ncbi:MAG TPA: ParB/RepB/Spo0J family partition protein [Candidatus Paceibacterota bacterium]|nr:ParB/RepB/Spo0J family partition protein [Candidatus Paceibacterota bacterium]
MISKTIQVSKITKPLTEREHDKEKLQELAESILSNGLLQNPILNKNFRCISGWGRVEAHKLANIKTIEVKINEDINDGGELIVSLIENIHREDLNPIDKAKCLKKVKDLEHLTNKEVGNKVGLSEVRIQHLLAILNLEDEIKKVCLRTNELTDTTTLTDISRIENKEDRIKVLEKLKEGKVVRQLARIIVKSPIEVKEALLKDEITTEQAERIVKLKTQKEREQAIREHKTISVAEKIIETKIADETPKKISAKFKREQEKKLVQVGNWIESFRGSVTDSYSQLEKTIKLLMVCLKFLPYMDNNNKEKLESQLNRFESVLERAEQITTQIKDKL